MQSIAHGFNEITLANAGVWVRVFDATGAFSPGVRSIEATNLLVSPAPAYVMPQYAGTAVPVNGVDTGYQLEPGQSVELSAANKDTGRIIALWARSAAAVFTHAVTLH